LGKIQVKGGSDMRLEESAPIYPAINVTKTN